MTELQRLLDGEGDEVEQALLDSAVRDAPPKAAGRRTLAALGIGSGLVASGTSATTAAAAGAGQAVAGGAAQTAVAVGSKAGIGVLVKWVGIAAVGGVATLGVVDQVMESDPSPAPAVAAIAPAVRQVEARARPAAAAAPQSVESSPADVDEQEPVEEPPEEEAAPPAGAGSVAARPSATVDAGLGAEVRALDRARTAMQAGEPEKALRALEAYDREFSRGTLGPEAQVLRIDALVRAGRGGQAAALARRFLASHPHSPHARRVRSLLAAMPTSEQAP